MQMLLNVMSKQPALYLYAIILILHFVMWPFGVMRFIVKYLNMLHLSWEKTEKAAQKHYLCLTFRL